MIADRQSSFAAAFVAGVTVRPIEAVAGVGTCFAALDDQERAVSVMLDFMNPACTRRRMIDCGSELWADKLQRHAIDLAKVEEIASLPQGFALET